MNDINKIRNRIKNQLLKKKEISIDEQQKKDIDFLILHLTGKIEPDVNNQD